MMPIQFSNGLNKHQSKKVASSQTFRPGAEVDGGPRVAMATLSQSSTTPVATPTM